MSPRNKSLTISVRLYLIVLTLFTANTITFILFQHYREIQYKIERLDYQMHDNNDNLYNILSKHVPDSVFIQNGTDSLLHRICDSVAKLPSTIIDNSIRLTVINKNGTVIYDSEIQHYDTLQNHSNRTEIKNALKNGHGYATDRKSKSTSKEYFYSATFYKDKNIIIRSACPYNQILMETLRADRGYIWIAITVLILLTILLYPITHKIGSNIHNLNKFAVRADSGEEIKAEEIAQFTDDELGDISEHIIKLYIKLQNTRKEQAKLKRELTENAAHELKTPVSSIRGYLETIVEQYDTMTEETKKKFILNCYTQSERLCNLIQDISTLNRLDDGKQYIDIEPVDICETVKKVINESEKQLSDNKMIVETHIPQGLAVNGSSSMIYSIFRNLMDNAINYAGQGSVIRIKVQTEEDDDNNETETIYHFTFEDNGIGVKQEHLDRLFERFYRVDKGRSRKMGGTGLGLAIVKNAVLLHNGKITVNQAVGGGLRFDFSLPCYMKA